MVQIKELRYAASRRIGALRFARGFKKASITHKEFEPKFQLFWNLKLDFFPVKKSFSQIFQNTANLFHLNFISKKKKKNQRNFFSPKYPPFWNLKLDFFPLKKSFSKIFQNTAHLFYLNFISKKKTKKSENRFFAKKTPTTHKEFDFFPPKYPHFETWSWIFFR